MILVHQKFKTLCLYRKAALNDKKKDEIEMRLKGQHEPSFRPALTQRSIELSTGNAFKDQRHSLSQPRTNQLYSQAGDIQLRREKVWVSPVDHDANEASAHPYKPNLNENSRKLVEAQRQGTVERNQQLV